MSWIDELGDPCLVAAVRSAADALNHLAEWMEKGTGHTVRPGQKVVVSNQSGYAGASVYNYGTTPLRFRVEEAN